MIHHRDVPSRPEARQGGVEAFRRCHRAAVDPAGSRVGGNHVVIARPGVGGEVAGQQHGPTVRRRLDLAEDVGEQDRRARVAFGQAGEAVWRAQAVEPVEAQPGGIRSAGQQPAGEGVGLQRDDRFKAGQKSRRQRVAGVGADDYQFALVGLPVCQPGGDLGVERRPQAVPVACGAQVIDEPAARVEQVIAQDGAGCGHGMGLW